MFFDGFLLRRNKHVRRNREFETSKALTIFYFFRYLNKHASDDVVNRVRPGGSHKYVMGISEWFLKMFHFRSTLCLQCFFGRHPVPEGVQPDCFQPAFCSGCNR